MDHKVPRDVCGFELKKNDNGTFAKDAMNILKKSDLQITQRRKRKSQGDRMNNKEANTIV